MFPRRSVRPAGGGARRATIGDGGDGDSTNDPLAIAVIVGSSRTAGPPYPARLGARVGAFAAAALRARGHAIDVVDAADEAAAGLALSPMRPHFAFAPAGRKNAAPAHLEAGTDRARSPPTRRATASLLEECAL